LISNAFLYQAAWLTGKGLFWGNLIGIGLSMLQLKTGIISLDPASYYLDTVPVNLDPANILLLNAGAMVAIVLMLLIPARLIGRITPVKAIRYE
jgi:lipoprotein-releasing system permease protein